MQEFLKNQLLELYTKYTVGGLYLCMKYLFFYVLHENKCMIFYIIVDFY